MKSEGLIQRLTNPSWRREILWIGSSREMPSAALKPILHRIYFCAFENSGQQLGKPNYLLTVISLCSSEPLPEKFLSSIAHLPAGKPVCLIVRDEDETAAKNAIQIMNRVPVHRIVSVAEGDYDLPQALLEILTDAADQGGAFDVESVMRERTEHLSRSKMALDKQVARTRAIVRFVKDVAGISTIDEFMNLLRQELRHFQKVKEPVLAYVNSHQEPRLVFFQRSQVYEKSAQSAWPLAKGLRTNDLKDSRYLANVVGRPVAKLLTVPLELHRLIGQENIQAPAAIFFEHALSKKELDGFIQWVEERLNPMSVALDRILLGQDLLEGSALWERTFDGIQDAVAILDNDGEIIRANKAFFSVFKNVERQDLLADKLIIDDRYYEVHSYPINSGRDGKSTHIIQHYVDVTVAHQLQKQMIQSEKMAALGNLAGHIAHELNNPLTGIRSMAQLLVEQTKDRGNLHQDLIEVEKAAERCQLIIKNLLDFSTGAVNRQVTVSMKELIVRTLPLLKTAMGSLETEFDFTKETDTVHVEPQLMQQVIFNIIKNACQAMTSGGKLIIRTRVDRKASPPMVEVDIEDNGPGIPPEILNQVFEYFFTTKSPGQGTGLGLSMSKSIVDRFGGRIHARSEVGKGSCFTLGLPLKKER